jgi:hypothetical protein
MARADHVRLLEVPIGQRRQAIRALWGLYLGISEQLLGGCSVAQDSQGFETRFLVRLMAWEFDYTAGFLRGRPRCQTALAKRAASGAIGRRPRLAGHACVRERHLDRQGPGNASFRAPTHGHGWLLRGGPAPAPKPRRARGPARQCPPVPRPRLQLEADPET